MVAVEVRQDEQVDPGDPEQVQARPEPFLVVAGVHERDGVVTAEQHGVPLPDVARGERPVPRYRAPDDEHRHGDRCDTDHDHDPRREQHPGAELPPDQHGDRDAAAHEHGGGHTEHTGRPGCRGVRQGGRPVCDAPDGGGRDPRDGREPLRTHRPHRSETTRGESDHRDDRRERLRQQVRRHRVGRERRRQRDRHRPARHLRRDGDRECGGERRPHTTSQELGERRAEHHDPARGEHGQGERERPCEPGVDDEHADRGEGDERDAPHRSTGQVHDEHHDRHHRRPDDRGVGPHEHDEHQEHADGCRGPGASREPAGTAEDHDEADHHRAVRPGHRRQVRQRRGLHRCLGRRVEAGAVPDRESAQQCRSGLRQVGRGPDEGLSRGVGGAEQPVGRHRRRRPAQERHERGRRSGFVRLHGGGHGDPGTGCQHGSRCTAVLVGDEPDRHAEPVELVGAHERRGDGAVTRHEVAGQHRLDVDAPRPRTGDERTERFRGPPGLPHGDRHREQRRQGPRDEQQPGDDYHDPGAPPPPE